jgi:hypothetical protein
MLFRTNFLRSQITWAVRTATAWGADIVSISSNNPCNLDCGLWLSGTFLATVDAQRAGVTLVASAGNKGVDVDQAPSWPCSLPPVDGTPGTICVGALEPGTTQRRAGTNYGATVDIFAPTLFPTTPNPASLGNDPPFAFGSGTSASAPFVAGVLAMMKAVDPTLTPTQLDSLLKEAARVDSPDPTVHHYLDAFSAVLAAAGGVLPPDQFEPNDTVGSATPLLPGTAYDGLTLGTDRDYYQFSIADYSDVTIDVDYMVGLSTVRPILLDVGDTPPLIGAPVVEIHPEGTVEGEAHHWSLAPGTYVVVMLSGLNLYNLTLDVTSTPLQPDVFEVNDSIATAAAPGSGHHVANLHTTSDVDHYAFEVPALDPVLQVFHFGLAFSERPVELTLFKDGLEVVSLPASTTPSVDLHEPGDYVVRIDAPDRTRYGFNLGLEATEALTGSDFPVPVERFWFIDPTGAVDRWLFGPREGLVLPQNDYQLETFEGLILEGQDLHATVYSLAGDVVAEGEPLGDSTGTSAELVSFEATTVDQTYILVIDRTEVLDTAGLQPAVPYALSWQEVP